MLRKIFDRRTLLGYGGLFGAGLLGTRSLAMAAQCVKTPRQTEGPFYPVVFPRDRDADLTRVEGHAAPAKGLLVVVQGTVKDAACRPVAGAVVEVWQACANGRYNDGRDSNPKPRDLDFQGWGRVVTGADGRYAFTTIKPGAYPTDPSDPQSWIRPPHIHFSVSAPGYPRLVTQLYFAGEALNDTDEILLDLRQRVGDAEAARVVVAFEGTGLDVSDPLRGRFDITVGAAGARGLTPVLD